VVLEGFKSPEVRRKNGKIFQISIFGSQCIVINLERRLNLFLLYIWFIFLKKNTDTRPAHSCVYLTCTLDWFQVLWIFWTRSVPDQVSVVWEKRYQNWTWTSVLQILEPKTGHPWTNQQSLMLTPTLLFVLVFYSTKHDELLQFSFIFAVFFLAGGHYFFNIISCRFYFILRWPLFFFFPWFWKTNISTQSSILNYICR
jgi:hypothetical protein